MILPISPYPTIPKIPNINIKKIISGDFIPSRYLQYAPGIQGVYNSIRSTYWSFNEVFADRARLPPEKRRIRSLISRIKNYCQRFFYEMKVAIQAGAYHIVHGTLSLGASVCGMMSSLHDVGAIDLGRKLRVCNVLQTCFSLPATIMALDHYVGEYRKASQLPPNPTEKDRDISFNKKFAAVLGLIGAVSSLIGFAISFLSGAALLAFILGCMGSFTGTLQSIYDFFFPTPSEPNYLKV